MKVPTLEDIRAARERIAPVIRETPLRFSESISLMVGYPVHFKLENHQKTGSFKLRGAANRILGGSVSPAGVIAASAGNHAQGVAFAASQAKLSATIVMPVGAPITKVDATRSYGARVIQQGANYDECYQVATKLGKEDGLEYIHAFDDPLIIAGQGTIGLEVLEQLPQVEQVLIPLGGGGLASGIAAVIKEIRPSVRIIGVQAQGADAIYRSFRQGKLTETETVSTIADGIAIKRPGELTTEMILKHVDTVLTVSDEEIASAMLISLERLKTLVEGAGAVGLAAVMYRRDLLSRGNTAIVVSGGNVDVNLMARLIERGLFKTGRLAVLQVTVPDRPGNLQRILNIVANMGANVITINHDRISHELPLEWTQITMSLETRNQAHIDELVRELRGQGIFIKVV